jgi:two-component system, OmpR family, alkaline phosphatase synthesis response regulator PhoP
MTARQLLLIEDDRAMAIGLSFNLRKEGYEVLHRADGEKGLASAQEGGFDLIILDMMLPGISGQDVLQRLRKTDVRTPVLILSALSGSQKIVDGLDQGADDYLAKPFELDVLLARVRSLLRSRQWLQEKEIAPAPEAGERFGENIVDFRRQSLQTPRGEHALSHKEAMLLRKLMEQEGQIVPREQLLKDVWGYSVQVQTRTLDQFVLALRKKIEPDPKSPRHLLTVQGLGYRFLKN